MTLRLRSFFVLAAACGLTWLHTASGSLAQTGRHYLQRADAPPGIVGHAQTMRVPTLRGYMQPVEMHVPPGAVVSVADSGQFGPAYAGSLKAGLLVGEVYRFRIAMNVGGREVEVFPSVELISRLHPPSGQELRFPVPIEMTREEIELASRGSFMVRVIYLEDPNQAFPRAEIPGDPRIRQVRTEDPLEVADRAGRPMAIIRLGSRVPELNAAGQLPFATPPVMQFAPGTETTHVETARGIDPAARGLETELRGRQFPRVPDTSLPVYRR